MFAILCQSTGDPLLLDYWLNRLKILKPLRKSLTVYLCVAAPLTPIQSEIIYNAISHCEFDIRTIMIPNVIQHGHCINAMLGAVKEDYVLLMEDDVFILDYNQVLIDLQTIWANRVTIIGVKGGSCSQEISVRAKELWPYTDGAFRFCPYYLITTKDLLLNTERWFHSRRWESGEYIPWLDMIANTQLVGDTMVSTSLEIHHKILSKYTNPLSKIKYRIGNHNALPSDITSQKTKDTNSIFSTTAFLCHAGSLSQMIHEALTINGSSLIDFGHIASNSENMLKQLCADDVPFSNFMHIKIAWLKVITTYISDYIKTKSNQMAYCNAYIASIDNAIEVLKLNRNIISQYYQAYIKI